VTGAGPGTETPLHHPVQTSPPVVLGSLADQLGADFAAACAELAQARLRRRDRDSREHRAAVEECSARVDVVLDLYLETCHAGRAVR
jgi:hypothetical protein